MVRVSFEQRPSVTITTGDRRSVRVLEINTLEVDINVADTVVVLSIQVSLLDTDKTNTSSPGKIHFFVAAVTVAVCTDSTTGMKYITARPAKLVDFVLAEVGSVDIFLLVLHERS